MSVTYSEPRAPDPLAAAREREATSTASQPGVALWKLLAGLGLVVAGIDLAEKFADARTLVVIGALFTALAVSSHLWGRDSRDGADWKLKKRRASAADPTVVPPRDGWGS